MLPSFDPVALRLKALQGLGGQPSPETPDPGVVSNVQPPDLDMYRPASDEMWGPTYDVNSRIGQLYKPQMTAQNNFNSNLAMFPNRTNFQPSPLRRIGATIAGMGVGGPVGIAHGAPIGYRGDPAAAFKVASGINDEPYNQAIEDWSNKIKPLELAATNEERTNTNNRNFAEQTVRNELTEQQRENERQKSQQINDFKYTQLSQQNDIAQANLQKAYDTLKQNADNANARLELSRAQMAATEAKHQLDLAERQREHNEKMAELIRQHDATVKEMNDKLDEAKRTNILRFGGTINTTQVRDAQGNLVGTRTSTTTRNGQPSMAISHGPTNTKKQISMLGPDGKTYLVDEDKVQDATSHGMKVVNQ